MKSLVLTLFAFLMASSAQASTKFSIMGDVNFFKAATSPAAANPASAGLGYGGGLGVEFGLSSSVGLAIEAIYEMRKQEFTGAVVKTTGIVFPVAARIALSPNFNLLLGGFYAMAMGKVKSEILGVAQEYDYGSANAPYKKGDYGAVAGIGINFPGSGGAFFIDARYYLGLADLNDPAVAGSTTKSTNIQGLVGYRFGKGK